jgi:hypothetical protein
MIDEKQSKHYKFSSIEHPVCTVREPGIRNALEIDIYKSVSDCITNEQNKLFVCMI